MSGTNLCRHNLAVSAKSADFWLSGRHVADMSATFPAKLTALSAIAARQSNGTQAVVEACHQVLDYVATHPDASIHYHACDMILAVDTDASYLSEIGGKMLVALTKCRA